MVFRDEICLAKLKIFKTKNSIAKRSSREKTLAFIVSNKLMCMCSTLFLDDFLKQSNGMITMYSLKNPSFPEWVNSTLKGSVRIFQVFTGLMFRTRALLLATVASTHLITAIHKTINTVLNLNHHTHNTYTIQKTQN